MKIYFVTIFCLAMATSGMAQSIDYNISGGYVANGYDVVAYFDNKAVKGSNKFTATHDGVKYRFSDTNNLNKFKQNPEKYVPQYGGYCAYAVATKSEKVSIDPETFEIRDGKLYLFYNSWGTNTLKYWKKEMPETLRENADKNWEKIKGYK
ncbi:MAG: YHS domain-containing (seleno)protein [Bacteroidota bacterium]